MTINLAHTNSCCAPGCLSTRGAERRRPILGPQGFPGASMLAAHRGASQYGLPEFLASSTVFFNWLLITSHNFMDGKLISIMTDICVSWWFFYCSRRWLCLLRMSIWASRPGMCSPKAMVSRAGRGPSGWLFTRGGVGDLGWWRHAGCVLCSGRPRAVLLLRGVFCAGVAAVECGL